MKVKKLTASKIVYRISLFLLVGFLCVPSVHALVFALVETVTATVETTPVAHSNDAADDPAIWIHPTDPSKSTIIGTDKGGALEVYRVSDGVRIQQIALSGGTNNVDLRYNFPLGTERVDVVVASIGQAFKAYRVDPNNGLLSDITGSVSGVGGGGMALYHSKVTDKFYYFSNDNCVLKQSELSGSTGKVNATVVRTVSFGDCSGTDAKSEGVVADDTYGSVYVSEELVAIWKFSAEPNGGSTKTAVDTAQSGHFVPDVEGLAIYYKRDGSGYLLASSQGKTSTGGNSNTYIVYQRTGNNAYIGNFRIGDGTIDGATNTDGIDVINVPLGPKFPQGVFVAQDGVNTGGNQNFKLVPWEQIASKFNLVSDTMYNPRIGSNSTVTPTIATTAPPSVNPTEPCATVPLTTGRVNMSMTVPGSGTYKLLSRVSVPDTQRLYSYWLQIDNTCPVQIGKAGIIPNTWTWIDNKLTPTNGMMMVFLTEGQHQITLIGNETGMKIDALRFTTDLACLPTNVAGTCPQPTPTLTVVPTVIPSPTKIVVTNTPVPTRVPTLTMTPTSIPSPTPTRIPTATPVPTKVPIPTPTRAVTPTPASGTLSVSPVADTFVIRDDKRNYGSKDTLEVDGDPVKIIYTKFNVSTLVGKKVTHATLRLRVFNTSAAAMNVKRVGNTSWLESMTYSNRPDLGNTITTFSAPNKDTWIDIDVTGVFDGSFGQQVSLGINSTVENGADFYAREDKNYPPKLIIRYQ